MAKNILSSKIILPATIAMATMALVAPINIVAIAQDMMQYPDEEQANPQKDKSHNPKDKNSDDSDWKFDENGNLYAPSSDENPPQEESPAKKKPTLKDAGEYETYDDNIYNQTAPDDAAIIAATPHRKREIEPAKKLKLMELSRIFGELHAIRVSCAGQGDQTYRSKMATMLDIEAPSAEYIRDPLIMAFNSGFESLGQGQNPCPKDDGKREASFAKQGRNISLQMAKIYRTAAETNTQPKF